MSAQSAQKISRQFRIFLEKTTKKGPAKRTNTSCLRKPPKKGWFSRPKSCCFGSQTCHPWAKLRHFAWKSFPRTPAYRVPRTMCYAHHVLRAQCVPSRISRIGKRITVVQPAQPAAEQRGWPRRAQRQAAPAASRHTQAVRVHTHVAARAWPPCTPCAAMPRGRCSRLARRCTPRAC